MAKAIELERHLASSGPWGAPTIEHLRKKLRRERMLQCSGQGYAARDIVASDVTAYFIGLVAADEIKNAPGVIMLARSSYHYASRSENCEPWPFVGITENASLGEFLDALFEGRVSSSIDPGFAHWDMRFEFQIVSGDLRFFAKMIFNNHVIQFFGLNEEIRAQLDSGNEVGLSTPPQVDRVCVVRTKFLRELIAFTTNAVSPDVEGTRSVQREISTDNPFYNNGHKNAPRHSSMEGNQ